MPAARTLLALCVLAAALVARPPSARGEEYQSYTLRHKDARDVEKLVHELLPGRKDVHVVADPRTKQLLVSGPESAQQVVRQLIEAIDKPAEKTPHTAKAQPEDAAPAVRVYRCPPGELERTAQKLKDYFADDGRVRVSLDADSSQILVVAPAEVHEAIDREFERKFQRTDAAPEDARTPEGELSVERMLPLRRAKLATIETALADLFGARLRRQAEPGADTYLEISSTSKRQTRITLDTGRNSVLINGPRTTVEQLARLVTVIDGGNAADRAARIVPIRGADANALKAALDAFRKGYRSSPPSVPAGGSKDEIENTEGAAESGEPSIQLAGAQEVPAAEVPPVEPAATPPAPAAEPEDAGRRRLRQLGADVQIESLDDLDTLILRGNPRDVEELTRIIKEIERMSTQTVPRVEIIPLKHAGSDAVSEIVTKVRTELTGTLRGRVEAVSLARPNAVLLIGWGEALKSAKALVEKLDQPDVADSQFRAFRLKHASASEIAQSVTTFFANRGAQQRARVTVVGDSRTNSLLAHGSPGDLDEIAKLVERLDTPGSASVRQARIFKLKHSLATDVATTLQTAIDGVPGQGQGRQNSAILELMTIDPRGEKVLRSGVLRGVRITADVQHNTLIVQAPPESMDLLEALIRQLDEAPTAAGQIKVFRIVNGDASALIQMLRALLPTQTGTSTAPLLPTGSGEASLAPLRFAVDLRTNSIIATGSADELKIIEALLLRLDEKEVQQRRNAVYRLKNAPALAVASAINDFLRSERQVQQAAPSAVSPFAQIESEVVVVAEPISNSLILSATPRFFNDISQLVEQLDAQPPQVMIQVLIAEVDLNDADQFGIELGIQDSVLFDRSLLGNLVTTTASTQTSTPSGVVTQTNQFIRAAENTPGFNFNASPLPALGNSGSDLSRRTAEVLAGQAVTNFSVNRTADELGFSGLVLSAGNESLNLLIRALQESRRLEVLSRPQVMTLDNQPAYIQVGQRVPRIVASTINQLGQVNSVQLENVGLILAVTPRISPDGLVVLEIDAEKSDVGPDIEGIPISVSPSGAVIRSPRINLTTAQTTVSASSGETIVLGGLITKSVSQTSRRVPWLSDVPLLGRLFRYDSVLARRRELLIVMTPHVVRTPQDVESIKQQEAARMHWTCSDVHDIHGTGELCRSGQCPICERAIPVIHPDVNPRGYVPDATTPPALTPPVPELRAAPPREVPSPPPPAPPATETKPLLLNPPPETADGQVIVPSAFEVEQPATEIKAAVPATGPTGNDEVKNTSKKFSWFNNPSAKSRTILRNRPAELPAGWGR